MSNPAFELIGLDALRNDPRYIEIDGDAPDRNGDGQADRLTVVVMDTGVDTEHELLSPNILDYVDFIGDNDTFTNLDPTIDSPNAFTVPENAIDVGTVVATDPEGSPITFSIVGGADSIVVVDGAEEDRFSINSATGALSFRTAPDFENPGDSDSNNVYTIDIQASDGQNPVSQSITITVTDVNEVPANLAPSFTGSSTFSIAENTTNVGTITATDPENNALSFSVSGGLDQNRFTIDASTGALSFVEPPDFENRRDAGRDNIYNVEVSVTDGQNTVSQDIAITVTDNRDESTGVGGLSNNGDPDGHGTHVAGIIGSTDPDIGIANNVDLIGLRVLGDGQDGSEIAEALQWVLDHRAEYNIVAVNMSLGIPSAFYTQPPDGQADPIYSTWNRLIDNLEAAGITVVSAAGNSYAQNHINNNLRENVSIPAIASTAAVGAVWQDGTVTNARWTGSRDYTTGADRLVSFSQRLSTYDGMLFAPGAVIESTLPGNTTGGLSGTSMAAPMVSGTVALMQDAALTFGDRLLTPDEIRQILIRTADVIVDGDNEDTDVTPTNSSYLRIDVYDAVQAVDRLFTGTPVPAVGEQQFFRFVFNSSLQPEDFYQGYGYAAAGTYQVGQSITVEGGGTYTITEALNNQSGTAGEVVVTDYYDGSTEFGYAIYVDATGSNGLGSESGNAYDGNFSGVDTSFSPNDTADLQAAPTINQLYYFTYTYGNGDSYQGYGYAAAGTYTAGQRITASASNELGLPGEYVINNVYEDNSGVVDVVTVYSYYDGADGNGDEAGGGYGYASSVSGYGFGGLGSEEGYAYDYNFASVDAFFSQTQEANLFDGIVVPPTQQLYYFTYTYGNGDFYQGYGYADGGTYTTGQRIAAASNELGLTGEYVIDEVYDDSYGFVGEVIVYSYYDGADGNGEELGGGSGYAYETYGYGFGGLGSESGYAYDYSYLSEDVYFSQFDEANLTSGEPISSGSQVYYFRYYYDNGDFYEGYGFTTAGTYTRDQRIDRDSPNEVDFTGYYVITDVYDTLYSYFPEVYVYSYYDGADGNGDQPGGGYGYAFDVYGYGYGELGSESGYAYDHNYRSTDVFFSNFDEANLVTDFGGQNQIYYFTYNYGNGDFYQGYGYAAAGTYTLGEQIRSNSPNETREIGFYSIDAVYADSTGYLGSVIVNYYYDADTGYGPAISAYGYGYGGLGTESGYAYDADYISTDTYFSNVDEVDLLLPSRQNQLYYFTYYYGEGNSFDYYEGYGYAAEGTYEAGQRIDLDTPNETGGTGYYQISNVYDVSYGFVGQVSVYNYNDVDTGYGPAYSVFAEGYSGLGSESGYAYDFNYSSPDNYISNYNEADLSIGSGGVDLYYFTYTYGNGDLYQGYGYAQAGTYFQGQQINQALPNETDNPGNLGFYSIDSVYANSYYSSVNSVYVYSYYDSDTDYGWAWSAWGEGYEGLGSESGYAYDYNYITTDPFFGNGGDAFYEADLLVNFGTDTNPTLATATNLGLISERNLTVLDDPSTANFNLGSDPNSNGSVPADVDMYRFELSQAGTLSLETSLPANGTSMDTILRLFDVYGNELGSDDDTGPNFYSRINAYLEAGTYYFGVSGYANFSYSPTSANSGITGSNGDYAVSIGFDPDETPPLVDPNGTRNGFDDPNTPDLDESQFTGARNSTSNLNNRRSVGGYDIPALLGIDTRFQQDDPNTDINELDLYPENLISVGSQDVDLVSFTLPAENFQPELIIFQTSDYIPDYLAIFNGDEDRANVYLDLLDSDRNRRMDDLADTVLRLFDANGTQLAIDDDGGEGLLSRLEYVFDAPGTYYVGISGNGNSTYDITTAANQVATDATRRAGSTGTAFFSLILQSQSQPEYLDPNGIDSGAILIDLPYGSSLTRAETIGSDIVAEQTIEVPTGDVDLYRFTASETGVVLIDLDTASSADLDTYLRVFNGTGTAIVSIASNDDSVAQDFNGNRISEAENNAKDSFVQLDVTAGSTYYIGVSATGNIDYNPTSFVPERTRATTGSYEITLQYGSAATDSDGYINSNLSDTDLTNTHTGLGRLRNLQGSIDQGLDVDFFKISFDLGSGIPQRVLTAKVERDARGGNPSAQEFYPTVYLFDEDGVLIADETSSEDANEISGIAVSPDTTYYIAVSGYGNEGFNPHAPNSGRNATSTGSYTLDLSLSGGGLDVGGLNAANRQGSLYGNSLDFDLDFFGQEQELGQSRIYTLGSTPRTILASLGEDIDQANDTAEETNAFGRLYLAAQGLTGTAANITATSSDVGADDVDIYPINITEAGTYQFTTSGTGNAIDDARPTLKVYDSTGEAVEVTDYGSQGIVTGNILASLAEGQHYLVVMSTGAATDQFTFGTDPGFNPELTEAQLREFYQNTGNYQLDMVAVPSLSQPTTFLDGTSFAQQFSLPLDVESLQLYGASGITPSLSVTDPSDNAVAGSLVYDEDNNNLRFVPTNPLLTGGTYTISYSDPSDFQVNDTLDADNLASATFEVSASDRFIYLPSFARGPGQAVDIGGEGIPVSISNTEGLTNIRITVDYDTDALNITGAELAAGLEGWELVGTPTIRNGRITVDIRDIAEDGVDNALPEGDREVIRLIADVPANAVFNSAEVLEVSAGARAGSRSVTISDSTSVQKVAYFGDVGGTPDGIVDFGDVLSAALKFLENRSGFDAYDLTDPNLIGDVNSDGNIDFGDVLAMAQKFLNGSSPLIPDTEPLPGSTASLIDPVVSVSDVQAQAGERANVVISLDSTEGAIQSFNFTVRYDTTKLDIAASDITLSTDITGLGFSQVAPPTVDEAAGLIRYGGINFAGTISVDSTPNLVNLNFLVLDGVNANDVITIDMSDATSETGFFGTTSNRLSPLTVNDGSITIAAAPVEDNFDVTTPTDTNTATNTIAENAANGTIVGITANATDADDVANSTVTYSLTDNAGGRFAIDPDTGVVTVANGSLLDAEISASHNITVTATSADTSTATQTFTIAVTDVDEFDVTTPIDNDSALNTIAENAANETIVGITANATDGDALTNTVTYDLTDNANGRFAINPNTGVVTVANGSLLNFETADSHDITVQATSTDGSVSTQTFTLTVDDVNEAPTAVALTITVPTIAENTATTTRTKVADITVTDDALGTGTIALSGADAASFEVVGTELYLKAGVALDFETQSSYAVTVTVDDTTVGATPDVNANFTLTVTDVNEAPTIVGAPANFDVEFAENSTAVVLKITANDPEKEAITYGLVLTAVDAALFDINPTTGDLSFKSSPDFEVPKDAGADNTYNITVTATDKSGNSDTQAVSVKVINNQAPIAVDDAASLDLQDATSVTIRPLDNDTDPENDALSIGSVTDPENGIVTIDGEDLVYTPNAGFTGTDTFTYTISDGENTDTANVSVTVTDTPNTVELTPSVTSVDSNADNLTFEPTQNGRITLDNDRASTSYRVKNVTNGTDAVFDNLVGLYEVLDANGGIDTNGDGTADVTPGGNGYALAALDARVQNFTLRAGAGVTTAQQVGDVLLEGGKFYAPFVIANGGAIGVDGFITAENAEADGTFNDAARAVSDAVAYFSFVAANPDGVGHLRSYGNGVFGFEDLPSNLGVSDNDFNDAVFAFNFTAV